MNKKQLEFVMDELGFVGYRRVSMELIILMGKSGYYVESISVTAKGTATRDAKKCREKWLELQRIAKAVNLLESE